MSRLSHAPSAFRRWLVFNSVGAMGIAVQMSILLVLTSGLKLNYLLATGLAVEAAVLHNFYWHERWTWIDRRTGRKSRFVQQLLYFHLTNGAISLAGNLALMRLFVERLGFHYLPANALAIALCSIANFLAGDRIVFRSAAIHSRKGGINLPPKRCRIMVLSIFLAAGPLLFMAPSIEAADLHPETLRAWNEYVGMAEQRMAAELSSQRGFLALDFQDSAKAARERQAVLSGEIPITHIKSGESIEVPEGMIHHWRGSVLIPRASLNSVLSRVENPRTEDTRQEDVLDSRVLERTPGQLKIYLKLQRSKIVTVIFNTEHLVKYKHYGVDRAFSSSVATKIAEIERSSENTEREKPEGHDRGFLWRMNSYWRYQQVDGGVIVECESMTLSRSIPPLIEYLVRPLINKTAHESMQRTLKSMRDRMTRAYGANLEASESQLGYRLQVSRFLNLQPVTCNLKLFVTCDL